VTGALIAALGMGVGALVQSRRHGGKKRRLLMAD
jgi:hypothetical protein